MKILKDYCTTCVQEYLLDKNKELPQPDLVIEILEGYNIKTCLVHLQRAKELLEKAIRRSYN